jgi:hypothetical protein
LSRIWRSSIEESSVVASEHAFFDIINIEEELHFALRVAELRDVSLEVFLHAFRQVTQSQPNHFVVAFDDRFGIFLRVPNFGGNLAFELQIDADLK